MGGKDTDSTPRHMRIDPLIKDLDHMNVECGVGLIKNPKTRIRAPQASESASPTLTLRQFANQAVVVMLQADSLQRRLQWIKTKTCEKLEVIKNRQITCHLRLMAQI
jgi:hypothetical protein